MKLFNKKINQNKIDLLAELVKTSFKLKYNNSILGVLWVLIKPLLTFVIMYTIWSRFSVGSSIPNYAIHLLIGILMYTFFSELINMGQHSLLGMAHIILKVNFDREIVIVSSTLMAVLNLSINLIIYIVFAVISHTQTTVWGVLYFAFMLIVIYIFGLAFSMFLSIFLVYVRDVANIVELGLFALTWASPIYYSTDTLFANEHGNIIVELIKANPIGIVINTIRAALMRGEIQNFGLMLVYFIVGIAFLLFARRFFKAKVKRIAEFF